MVGDDPPTALEGLRRRYGDLFRLDLGDAPATVMLSSHDLIREAFSKESFSGRSWNEVPTLNAVNQLGQHGTGSSSTEGSSTRQCPKTLGCFPAGEFIYGVASSEGQTWYQQRRFMLKSLSDLGMGKRDTMEDIIEQEAEQLAEFFKKKEGMVITSRVRNGKSKLKLQGYGLIQGRVTRWSTISYSHFASFCLDQSALRAHAGQYSYLGQRVGY